MTLKHKGLALMSGVVLATVANLLLPGGPLVSPVDPTDFLAQVTAFGDNAILGHWANFVISAGLLLMAFGILGLYPSASRQEGWAGRLLQFGIVISVIEWTVVFVFGGTRHLVIYLMQMAKETPGVGAVPLQAAALDVHINAIALAVSFIFLAAVASTLVGVGVVARFRSTNIYRLSGYGLILVGVAVTIIFLVAMMSPGADLDPLFYVINSFLMLGNVCLFIVGRGMYKGVREMAA